MHDWGSGFRAECSSNASGLWVAGFGAKPRGFGVGFAQKLMSKANAWVAKSQRDLCRIMTSSYSTAILISGSGSSFVVPSPFLCQKGLGLQSGRRSNRAKSSDPGPPKASKLHEQPAHERERESGRGRDYAVTGCRKRERSNRD